MTREEARQNLVALGIEEPSEAQVTNYLNQFHSNRPNPQPQPAPQPTPEPTPNPEPDDNTRALLLQQNCICHQLQNILYKKKP